MKKQLLFILTAILPVLASAQVEINGIWYNLTRENKTAEVTSSATKYSGDLVIPEMVTHAGVKYVVTSIGNNAFASCSSLGSIIIPEGVTRIGNNAFSSCHMLRSVIIPEGVKSIGSNAFYNCQCITAIVLPNGLETIEFSAFSFCPLLKDIYCYAENVPSAKPNVFDGSNLKIAVLHVSPSVIDSYKASSPWNKFSNMKTNEEVEAPRATDISVQGTFDLNGRSISGGGLPVPSNMTHDEGRVVVTITVNPAGMVITTSINLRTNTTNPELRQAAEEAAKRARFNKVDGLENQTGTITYYFKMR